MVKSESTYRHGFAGVYVIVAISLLVLVGSVIFYAQYRGAQVRHEQAVAEAEKKAESSNQGPIAVDTSVNESVEIVVAQDSDKSVPGELPKTGIEMTSSFVSLGILVYSVLYYVRSRANTLTSRGV